MKFLFLVLSVALVVPAQRLTTLQGMSVVPGGTFEMGIDATDIQKLQVKFGVERSELFSEEVPRHTVTIGPFYMDKTEVTNEAFKRFLDKNREWRKDRMNPALQNGNYLKDWTDRNFPKGKEKYPVTYVTWYAATAFCRSLGKRLPTEAEWEFAARGGLKGKEFPWGDEMPDKLKANFFGSGIGSPRAVANYPSNNYWLYDMAGNVWEFLADEWSKYPTDTKPSGETDFLKVTTRRALRGGSFGGSAVNLRVTYRDSHKPENAVEHVGFRCAANVR